MKYSTCLLILGLTIAWFLSGCGGGDVVNPPLSPTPGPEQGAREWIDALANLDGNRRLKHTCLAQRETVNEVTMWQTAFAVLGQLLTNRSVQIEGDISDLKFETVNQNDNQAVVRVYGELRTAVLGSAQATQVDEQWQMIYENETWRWCGSNTGIPPLVPSSTPIAQVTVPPVSLTPTVTSTSIPRPTTTPTPTIDIQATQTAQVERQQQLAQFDLQGQLALTLSTRDNRIDATVVDVYVIDADGSKLTQLTDNAAADYAAAWSPDGKRILFNSDRDAPQNKYDVYMMDADGSNVIRLTDYPGFDYAAAWSPDGKRILFSSTRDDPKEKNIEVYVMDADGSNVIRLTDHPGLDGAAAWSPDGKRITFVSNREGNADVYVMDLDGDNVTNLTDNPAEDNGGLWSPDGKWISFVSKREGTQDLFIMNIDDRTLTKLTDIPGDKLLGPWSPDGKFIAFSSDASDRNDPLGSVDILDIYVIDVDRDKIGRLPNLPGLALVASWTLPKN